MHERIKSWYPFIDDTYFLHDYPTFTKVTEVNEWSACSTTCGNGKQYRVIPCPMPSTDCTPIQEWKDCNAGICDNSKKIYFGNLTFLSKRSNSLLFQLNPAGSYLPKVNRRNTRRRCEICSKLTIKTPERRQ